LRRFLRRRNLRGSDLGESTKKQRNTYSDYRKAFAGRRGKRRRNSRVAPPAIAVLAIKVEPLRGRFANLDRSARRSHREAAEAKRRSGAAA
jgi:hypothetical protein